MSLILAFYADDFTGATDALEQLSLGGVRTVLFTEPPTRTQPARFRGVEAIGIAGMTRAMAPREMERALRPAFQKLKRLNPRHVHYKVCSTFDSSPNIGNIGRAVDVGAEVFPGPFVPLLVAAPDLGRYCVFGNLFARMGIGSSGEIHRLDRHPSMSRHPITPMREADLRLHLGRQTEKQIGLLNVLELERSLRDSRSALKRILKGGAEIVLFDGLHNEHLQRAGELIDGFASPKKPLFSAGSSGIEMALCSHWNQSGKLRNDAKPAATRKASTILIGSGSCSPVTLAQIDWALSREFAEVALDVSAMASHVKAQSAMRHATNQARELLRAGRNVIVHTMARKRASRVGSPNGSLISELLGRVLRDTLAHADVQRVCIAGGDTSSVAARALGIEALEMIGCLTPGAPLCRAYASGSAIDGREIVFKGGQVGAENYFDLL